MSQMSSAPPTTKVGKDAPACRRQARKADAQRADAEDGEEDGAGREDRRQKPPTGQRRYGDREDLEATLHSFYTVLEPHLLWYSVMFVGSSLFT